MTRGRRMGVLAAVLVMSATVTSRGVTAAPEDCWACDTDWFCCAECWLWDTHKHQTLGLWNYDGHASSHDWVCDNCADHEIVVGCKGSAGLAAELSTAVANDSSVGDLLTANAHLVKLNPDRTTVVILDCGGSGDAYATIQLTPRQTAELINLAKRVT